MDIVAISNDSLKEFSMLFSSLAIGLLTGLLGTYLGFRAFRNFAQMTKRELSFRDLILNALIAGGAGTLIFFSLIVAMSLFDKEYIWTSRKVWGAILIALIPGGITTIGAFVQMLMIAGYRRILLDGLRKKDKK
jgi:hypothetical protein